MSFDEIKDEVAAANRILAEANLATGITAGFGHASLRVPGEPNLFVVKGRGYKIDVLSRMQPEDMVVCDLEGNLVEGAPGLSQCFEIKIHSCILASNPALNSVVHVHPEFSILAGVLDMPLVPMGGAGSQLFETPVPVYHHTGLVASEQQGSELADVIGDSPIVLLEGHGAVSTGKSLEQSVMTMWQLENQARMNWYAYCAAGPNHRRLPQEVIDEARNQPPFWKLPHMQPQFVGVTERPSGGAPGIWAHMNDLVK